MPAVSDEQFESQYRSQVIPAASRTFIWNVNFLKKAGEEWAWISYSVILIQEPRVQRVQSVQRLRYP